MATQLELDFETLGRHGGKDRYNKLMASINRLSILTEYAKNLQGFAFYTHSSVEGSRVAYGLGLYPIITTDDTPWSVHVAKLLLPLCDYHIIPSWSKDFWPINTPNSTYEYDGDITVSWTKNVNLTWKPEYILVREPEIQSSYVDYNFNEFRLLDKEFDGVFYANRYQGFNDIMEMISKSFCVITLCGSTVGKEACLLGVPTIMFTRGISNLSLNVLNYLKEKGFPVYGVDTYDDMKKLVKRFVSRPERMDTSKILHKMKSPVDIIESILNK